MDDLFSPPGTDWQRVSPRLLVVRRGVVLLVAATVSALAVGAVLGLDDEPGWLGGVMALAVLVGASWGWWVAGRSVRRWGYAERGDELYITHGALHRTLVVVPFGRMQFVDVAAGPLDQLLGIAKVHLHTASPVTGAVIPGLPADRAAALRDRLTALGEARAAGL